MKRLSCVNPFDGAPIYYIAETDSTMLDAAELAERGTPSGTVVIAGFQRAGRGRFVERKWISPPGKGLLFTLILDHEFLKTGPALTPLLAGLGVAFFVEEHAGRPCLVKWPNDVLVDGGKIAGILCLSKGRYVFTGVGINCLQLDDQGSGARRSPVYGAPVSPPPISLADLGVGECEPISILEEVLASLKRAFAASDPVGEIEKRLYLYGKSVTHWSGLPEKSEKLRGTVEGLGSDGQLLLREDETGSLHEVYGGELLPCAGLS